VGFAESDQSSEPGLVDRVLVQVSGGPAGAPPGVGEPPASDRGPRTLPSQSQPRSAARNDSGALVDVATDDTDPGNYADTEPSIAGNPVNPLEIAIVTFSEPWSGTRAAPVWKSSDGGTTWRKVFQIPQPVAGSNGPGDQKIAFDARGRLYVAELGVAGSRIQD